MNIKEAKEQIQNAMTAYFTKNQFGKYIIPTEKQRPIFLMGPPGIGKTAIMEQVAQELGVGLISYSMTHHTRQSALGLPFIVKKNYGGQEYDISEYTMSEIIASVYEVSENTGKKEGILFLDEINCVSETLAPAMLQFLQYKIFGRHKVPDGWIVVTAGNPPEYNNSVRDFDIVTWDRLKRIDVEPDFDVWKEYAYKTSVHASILTYLDIKKRNFYRIETTVDGKSFVTARGWSDLSDMLNLYERLGIKVDEKLVSQYLQNKKIAKDFAIYYDLFNKYKSDYQIEDILDGKATPELVERAQKAAFDERLSLLGLLLEGITGCFKNVYDTEAVLAQTGEVIKAIRPVVNRPDANLIKILDGQIKQLDQYIENEKKADALSTADENTIRSAILILENDMDKISGSDDVGASYKRIKSEQNKRVKELKSFAQETGRKLSNLFLFCEEAFSEGQELLILVTELTLSYYGAYFISRYGCDEYFAHNKDLLFYERQKEIIAELEKNLSQEEY